MQKTAFGSRLSMPGRFVAMPRRTGIITQTLLVMKLTMILLVISVFSVHAAGNAQEITLSGKKLTFKQIFTAVKEQTGYVVFVKKDLLQQTTPVDVSVRRMPVAKFLALVLQHQPLDFALRGEKTIVLSRKVPSAGPPDNSLLQAMSGSLLAGPVTGRVLNPEGQPLEGAAVRIKGSRAGVSTDAAGIFSIRGSAGELLVISYTGYKEKEVKIGAGLDLGGIVLDMSDSKLDEIQVIAYGTSTKRMNTGNVSVVTSAEISQQPVSNALLAIAGRVPGVYVQQASGLPGSAVSITIRGRNSIGAGNEPLYIVDGVPFLNTSLSQTTAAVQASPFNSINPADIESIDILKDADATAIYGSRAANGVVLITTKKGKAGKTKVDISIYTGGGRITRSPEMMNTQQYLQMRQTAFENDQETPDDFTAPDLKVWDTTAYTDYNKYFLGNTAKQTDANLSISGGDARTRFLLSNSFHRETTVYPGDNGYKRGTVHLNVEHNSLDNKLQVGVSAGYTVDENNSTSTDITGYVYRLPPNYPLYENGQLNWTVTDNPLAYLLQPYRGKTNTLVSNGTMRYQVIPGLYLKLNAGYSNMTLNERTLLPAISKNPTDIPTNDAQFNNKRFSSYILEPQADYSCKLGDGRINILAGGTWQQNITENTFIDAVDFATEALMNTPGAARRNTITTGYIQYRYESVFGRVNYNLKNRYIINGTFRRDGSTRFGPDKQFGNFWALGGAWIFTKEEWLHNRLPWLSHGKLRGSYALVGNDQIADYGYLSTYQSTYQSYNGMPGITPARISNPDYSWESSKKLEAALELSFLQDRLFISAAWFRNRCGNQLVNYPLSPQSGFSTYQANLPALVQNTGWELELTSTNIKNKTFTWTTAVNATIPKNKLLAFPGLAGSSYARDKVIGQSLNVSPAFIFKGVDAQTGEILFEDLVKDNVLQYGMAANGLGDQVGFTNDPSWYGGLQNSFSYKGWQLDLFFQYVNKSDFNLLRNTMFDPYGSMANAPVSILNTPFRPSTTPGTAAYDSYYYLTAGSDVIRSNASFLRLKNLSLSYTLPEAWLHAIKMRDARVYMRAQNLLTITKYDGYDPETSLLGFAVMPPLKMITAGIQCSF